MEAEAEALKFFLQNGSGSGSAIKIYRFQNAGLDDPKRPGLVPQWMGRSTSVFSGAQYAVGRKRIGFLF